MSELSIPVSLKIKAIAMIRKAMDEYGDVPSDIDERIDTEKVRSIAYDLISILETI